MSQWNQRRDSNQSNQDDSDGDQDLVVTGAGDIDTVVWFENHADGISIPWMTKHVLDAELERGPTPRYIIKILTRDGRRVDVVADARTGRILYER